MRRQTSSARIILTILLTVILTAALAVEAGAQRSGRRSNRYGRTGAEISMEFPRFGFATGRAFSEERDVGPGLGFGFGVMWGFSDNLAAEGRMLQTNHNSETADIPWDIDEVLIGGRFTFRTEDVFQPFVGLGFSRVALERDEGSSSAVGFERASWYGGYVAAGLDFVWSSQWSGFVRADYSVVGFGHETIGTEEADLGGKERGDTGAVSLGITYRIPSW
jgi:outer membrane protein W